MTRSGSGSTPRRTPIPKLAAASPRGDAVPPVYQTLLREELRHMQEVLRVLENALA